MTTTAKRMGYVVLGAAVIALLVIGATQMVQAPGESDPSPAPQVYRIIGEWEGHVAVFVPQTDVPETVYDTVVLSLPEDEQQKLLDGIEVADAVTLRQRLEDYLS